jgi:hypothetical protein
VAVGQNTKQLRNIKDVKLKRNLTREGHINEENITKEEQIKNTNRFGSYKCSYDAECETFLLHFS